MNLNNIMYMAVGIMVLAAFINRSPTLCVVAFVISVFGLCGFYSWVQGQFINGAIIIKKEKQNEANCYGY